MNFLEKHACSADKVTSEISEFPSLISLGNQWGKSSGIPRMSRYTHTYPRHIREINHYAELYQSPTVCYLPKQR